MFNKDSSMAANNTGFGGGSTAASARGYSRPLNGEEVINKSYPLMNMTDNNASLTSSSKIPRISTLKPVKNSRTLNNGVMSVKADSLNDNESMQVAGKRQSEFIKKISSMQKILKSTPY